MPVLVKFENDWSDEFLCQEFKVFDSREAYDKWLEGVHDLIRQDRSDFYFGTNEAHYFHDVSEIDACLTVYDLSDHKASVFEKFFKKSSFGVGGILDIDLDDYDDDE